MHWDVVIANGTGVDQERAETLDMRVLNGRIESQTPFREPYPAGVLVIDAAGKLVFLASSNPQPLAESGAGIFLMVETACWVRPNARQSIITATNNTYS
jgi:hypothetical protein